MSTAAVAPLELADLDLDFRRGTPRICFQCNGQIAPTANRGRRTCSDRCRKRLSRALKKAREAEDFALVRALSHGLLLRDLWRTNPRDFARLDAEFRFSLDAAASPEDSLCESFISPTEDALAVPWWPRTRSIDGHAPAAFVNPPYSIHGGGLDRWAMKCHAEAQAGIVVVEVVPPSMGTAYMHFAHHHAHEIRLHRYRRAFLDPRTGEERRQSRGDTCAVVWGPGPPPSGTARYAFDTSPP